MGHAPSEPGHHACLGRGGDPGASQAVSDAGGAQPPHRFWPERAGGAAGGPSTRQGPRVIVEGNHRQWPEASAGGLQGWTGGRGHAWCSDGPMPHAKFCAWRQRGSAAIGGGPGT